MDNDRGTPEDSKRTTARGAAGFAWNVGGMGAP